MKLRDKKHKKEESEKEKSRDKSPEKTKVIIAVDISFYYFCSVLYLIVTCREPIPQDGSLSSNFVPVDGYLTCTEGVSRIMGALQLTSQSETAFP